MSKLSKIWGGIWLTIVVGVAAIALLTNCAMIPTRTIDPKSWIQLDVQKTEFMNKGLANRVIFAKVVHREEAINILMIYTPDGNRVMSGVLIDANGDGVAEKALVNSGVYNDRVALNGYPFTAHGYPKTVAPQYMPSIQKDYDMVMKLWKTGKHISLLEMNAIVKALSAPELSAKYPSVPRR